MPDSWMDIGVNGTAKVGKLKTQLKGFGQKNTLCQTDLRRKLSVFKEIIGGATKPDPSNLLNEKLRKIPVAQKLVESSFDTITTTIVDLSSLMSKLQLDPKLSSAHVVELKDDIADQEK